ncbi:hypothetical protein HPB48_013665 [Haemaphysalis longicornis]|uniref:CCHC-type domain-containing protein n=1 Tax=Haemaphysalis longicornis TaxID=44386 RepID=A0A9J6FLE9_HAELO|nr:hypothetical protein HPB48_013665 [Haemaphysalis longicornis]
MPPKLEWPRRSRSCDSFLHKFAATRRAWKCTQQKSRRRFEGTFHPKESKKKQDNRHSPRQSRLATKSWPARSAARRRRLKGKQRAAFVTGDLLLLRPLPLHRTPARTTSPHTGGTSPRKVQNGSERLALRTPNISEPAEPGDKNPQEATPLANSNSENCNIPWFNETPTRIGIAPAGSLQKRQTDNTPVPSPTPQSCPKTSPEGQPKQAVAQTNEDPFPPLPPRTNPVPRTVPACPPTASRQSPSRDTLHTVLFKPADPKSPFRTVSAYSVGTATEHLWDIKDIRVNKARNIVAIDTTSDKSKTALLQMNSLCGITVAPQLASKEPIKVTGVVRGIDIPGTAAELVPHIRSPKEIVEANRSGNSLFLTFVGGTLPEHIYLANVRSPVHPTTPRPLQCYKCGRFNHIRVTCRHATRCERCAGDHDQADCNETQLKCANCQQDHKFSSPYCPRWQEEKKVLMEAAAKKIPKKQARFELSATKEDNRRTANNGCTYAQALDKTPNPAQPALIQQASPIVTEVVPVDPAISSMLSTAIETLASAIEIFKQHVRAT